MTKDGYTFTIAQAAILTGPELGEILGPDVASAVTAALRAARADEQGSRTVDLGEHRTAVIAALRELSSDANDPTRLQETEQLLKTLSA